ncbi:MAG: M48 family metallopeptidase [Melioribacteraceae bacterium]|nr:M48 family metallopeptidase [Melioribacteraceae bacterium]
MADKKRINIDSIGNVLLRKSSRAKRIAIKIKPSEGVLVIIPKRVSFLEGERFAISKKNWILKHLPKIEAIEKSVKVFDEQTEFRTKNFQLVIEKTNVKNIFVSIKKPIVKLSIPKEMDIKDQFVQNSIKFGIVETLRIEAKSFMPQRVKMFAEEFGFKYNKLFFKNVKTRWGSCSGLNNINLNIHLMRLPDELIDYVILHELVHTVHKNHSKTFWMKLEEVYPNSRKYDKELKKYSPNYY